MRIATISSHLRNLSFKLSESNTLCTHIWTFCGQNSIPSQPIIYSFLSITILNQSFKSLSDQTSLFVVSKQSQFILFGVGGATFGRATLQSRGGAVVCGSRFCFIRATFFSTIRTIQRKLLSGNRTGVMVV